MSPYSLEYAQSRGWVAQTPPPSMREALEALEALLAAGIPGTLSWQLAEVQARLVLRRLKGGK
jgi:hypothetical protein